MGDVAAGRHVFEITQQPGTFELAQRQRAPRGRRHRTRHAMRDQRVEQVDDAGTVRHTGRHQALVARVRILQQSIDRVGPDLLGDALAGERVAGADQREQERLGQHIPGLGASLRQAAQQRALAVQHQPVHVEDHRLRRRRQFHQQGHGRSPNRTCRSSADSTRHCPSARSSSASPPIRLRCRASTWLPTAANMRRTWW